MSVSESFAGCLVKKPSELLGTIFRKKTSSKKYVPLSRWGKVTQRKYDYLNEIQIADSKLKPLTPMPGSVISQMSDLNKVITDLDNWNISSSDFISWFEKKYHKAATKSDFLTFGKAQLELFTDGFREIDFRIGTLKTADRQMFREHHQKIFKRIQYGLDLIEKSPDLPTALERSKFLNTDVKGIMGEVRNSVHLANVKAIGVNVSEVPFCKRNMDAIFNKLENSTDAKFAMYQKMKAKYPKVFLPPWYTEEGFVEKLKDQKFVHQYIESLDRKMKTPYFSRYFGETTPEFTQKRLSEFKKSLERDPKSFKQLRASFPELVTIPQVSEEELPSYFLKERNWKDYVRDRKSLVGKKEIDFLMFDGKNWIWNETKNHSHIVGLKEFDAKIGRKTIRQQLEENLDLIDLLGLKGRMKLQFQSLSGVDPEVILELKKMGIGVLN